MRGETRKRDSVRVRARRDMGALGKDSLGSIIQTGTVVYNAGTLGGRSVMAPYVQCLAGYSQG